MRGLPARLGLKPSRRAIIGALLVAICAGAVIAGLNVQRRIEAERMAAELAALQTQAHEAAAVIAAALRPYGEALDRLAQDPAAVAALANHDEAARKAIATAELGRFPGALLLRLVPQHVTEPDASQSPPLTFASIDLMRTSARSEKPPPAELHLPGTPDEHIVLVRRVPPAGEPLGFLHLSLPVSIVDEALARRDTRRLELTVRQPISRGAPVTVARAGRAPEQEDGALPDPVVVPIAGTAWLLAARGVPEVEAGALARVAPFAIGILLVLALGGVWLLRRRRRVVPEGGGGTTTEFQGAIKAILGGEYPGLEDLLPGAAGAVAIGNSASRTDPASTPHPVLLDTGEQEMIDLMPDAGPEGEARPAATAVSPSIFRSYDIRGVVGQTLTPEAVYEIGRALGSEAAALGQQTVIVARDGRVSSVALHEALVGGLRDSGRDVLDIGLTPSPVLYFATHYLDTRTGVMITGSHNPPEYNGLKMVLNGETLSGEAIQAIRRRIEEQDFTSGAGTLEQVEIIPDYIRRITEDVPVSLGKALKVVVDCGNGVPGIVAPHILRALGHGVIELYCEVDGEFPNHHPDPSQPENLEDLIAIVRHEDADLGLAFDGDGDRLGVVDREGNILWPDRQMMLFARDVLSRNPGARIIYDVKCSRLLTDVIREAGGEPIMWKTGHSLIKSKMKETGALLAGEMSGHIFFKERWYGFDDALYSAARLLEILVEANEPPEAVFARLPNAVATPELRLDMPEERHASFMTQVKEAADFPDGTLIDVDGLRVDFPDSWGLIRASNTTPCLVLRFEGDDPAALERVQERFRRLLLGIDPALNLPF